jgi:hypothetical protein
VVRRRRRRRKWRRRGGRGGGGGEQEKEDILGLISAGKVIDSDEDHHPLEGRLRDRVLDLPLLLRERRVAQDEVRRGVPVAAAPVARAAGADAPVVVRLEPRRGEVRHVLARRGGGDVLRLLVDHIEDQLHKVLARLRAAGGPPARELAVWHLLTNMPVMTRICGSDTDPGDEEDNSPKPDETTTDLCSEQVCVFITAGPITKLCAWGRRRVEDMCYEIRRAEACVD